MFLFEHARGKDFRRIVGKNGHARLDDNRPAVYFLGNEMHTGSMFFQALPNGAFMGMKAGQLREKRGMDIDESTGEMLDEGGCQYPHEAGQYDETRSETLDKGDEFLIEGLPTWEGAMIQHRCLDAFLLCALKSQYIGLVADDRADFYGKVSAGGIDDCLKVTAAPGDQDDDGESGIAHMKGCHVKRTWEDCA